MISELSLSKARFPVTSPGIRSAVNCIRLKSALTDLANSLARDVFPVPGNPFKEDMAPCEKGAKKIFFEHLKDIL